MSFTTYRLLFFVLINRQREPLFAESMRLIEHSSALVISSQGGGPMPIAISDPNGTPRIDKNKDITSKSIDGISDLVVWAPIKEGFIDAFSNVTYETRLRQVAEGLHAVRKSAREHEKLSPFPDTAERILSLLDYRIGIVDEGLYRYEDISGQTVPWNEGPVDNKEPAHVILKPKRFMYLVATFDGPWEPYMRLIWKPLGPFLDLLLCNCEGYVTAGDHSFEQYAQWVRNNQLDSGIFYSTSGQTVKDKKYLSKLERIQREYSPAESYEKIARMTSDDPEILAREVRSRPENQREISRLALESLTVLYKLADYYPPDRIRLPNKTFGEGAYLLRVAREILSDWTGKALDERIRATYREPLSWYETPGELYPDLATPDPILDKSEVQKGLLSSYDPKDGNALTHGQLYLMRINDAEKARDFIKKLPISYETYAPENPDLSLTVNIAFTHNGLKRLELREDFLRAFPKEFREGMEQRATSIGDKWDNHPRRWSLPPRNFPPQTDLELPPVELHEVDIVLQLRTNMVLETDEEDKPSEYIPFSQKPQQQKTRSDGSKNLNDLLRGKFDFNQDGSIEPLSVISNAFQLEQLSNSATFKKQPELTLRNMGLRSNDQDDDAVSISELIKQIQVANTSGVTILSVQDMFRPDAYKTATDKLAAEDAARPGREHFGFRDGLSQPIPTSAPEKKTDVPIGDILLGYKNSRDDYAPNLDVPTETESKRVEFFKNGSFLAIRKMQQDVLAFEDFLDQKYGEVGCEREELAALLMGRRRDGRPLIASIDNEFDYSKDLAGERCPFASHIRRANPRSDVQGRKDPLILRRGMSYGYRFNPQAPDNDRGVVFMAYCASLAEQYEIIQRWVNGGNSTGVSSMHTDPIVGLHPRNRKNIFRFIKNGKVHDLEIDKPFTKLEWGLYLFTPSKSAIETMVSKPIALPDMSVAEGKKILNSISRMDQKQAQEEWKRILEDFLTKDPEKNNVSPKVTAAIDDMGGACDITSGVCFDEGKTKDQEPKPQRVILVTKEDLIEQVFKNSDSKKYSSREQADRMDQKNAFGMIYVARDPDTTKYKKEAYPTNDYLMAYSEEMAFNDGYRAGMTSLGPLKVLATRAAPKGTEPSLKLEIGRQYISDALGWLCHMWFGVPDAPQLNPSIPDTGFIAKGAWQWSSDRSQAVCPGDFMSPSRHGFYPRPTSAIEKYGLKDGKRLREAISNLIKACKDEGNEKYKEIQGTIGNKMWKELKDKPDVLERNLIGIMIGALPPMDANLRFAFYEWLSEDTIWDHQSAYHAEKRRINDNYKAAKVTLFDALAKSMSLRPAPDLIYRTATSDMRLGEIDVKKGNLVILHLAAATQSRLKRGEDASVNMIFGGDRSKENHAPHACPAMKMAMGGMMGIIAAFLDSGRIQTLPASLIVQLSGWKI